MSSNTTLILTNRYGAEQAAREAEGLIGNITRLAGDVDAIRQAQQSLKKALRALLRFASTTTTGDLRSSIGTNYDDLDILAEDLRLERDMLQARHDELRTALERYDQDRERDLLEREL